MSTALYDTLRALIREELGALRVSELGLVQAVLPADPDNYAATVALRDSELVLDAVPLLDPQAQRHRREARKSAPVSDAPRLSVSGCPYQNRCPHVMSRCRAEMPPAYAIDGGGTASCFLHATETCDPVRTAKDKESVVS